MLGRMSGETRSPPLAASACAPVLVDLRPHLVLEGEQVGVVELASLMATPTASGQRGRQEQSARRAASRPRPAGRDRNHSAVSPAAPAQAQPAVVRHSTAPRMKTPVASSAGGRWPLDHAEEAEGGPERHGGRPGVGLVVHPRQRPEEQQHGPRRAPDEQQRRTPRPPPRPRGAAPRRMRRTRHTSSAMSTVVAIHARSIEMAVSRPSKASVTRSSGMRASAGPGGKYICSWPLTTNASIPSDALGRRRGGRRGAPGPGGRRSSRTGGSAAPCGRGSSFRSQRIGDVRDERRPAAADHHRPGVATQAQVPRTGTETLVHRFTGRTVTSRPCTDARQWDRQVLDIEALERSLPELATRLRGRRSVPARGPRRGAATRRSIERAYAEFAGDPRRTRGRTTSTSTSASSPTRRPTRGAPRSRRWPRRSAPTGSSPCSSGSPGSRGCGPTPRWTVAGSTGASPAAS